jgi:Tol biopolymer transport system component
MGIIDGNTWLSFKSQSKDNSKIAFTKGAIPQFGSPNKDIIYMLDAKTNVPTIVFDSHSRDDISNIIRVAISPDGETLLFDARIGERHQIFQINSDGTELRQITNSEFDTMFPYWSPGGASFYAVVYEPNTFVSRLTLYSLNGEVINTISLENTWLWGWFGQ